MLFYLYFDDNDDDDNDDATKTIEFVLVVLLYTVKIGDFRESSAQRGDLTRSRRDVAYSGDKNSPG